MSFICDQCKTVVPPNVPCNLVTTETRIVTHVTKIKDKNGFTREERNNGTDIVKEQKLCPKCNTAFQLKAMADVGKSE